SGRDPLGRRHHIHRHRQRAGAAAARRPPARAVPGLIMSNAAARTGIPIVLAYSGGLDTSFLVPWLIEHERRPVITVTVDTGGIAAGNDQVRFEVALRTLAPDLKVLAPVRDEAFKRQDELEYLQQRALPVPPTAARYSVNRGLWGVTIGGRETLTSAGSIPDEAWLLTRDAFTRPRPAQRHVLGFRQGRPVALDGKAGSP